MDKFITPSQDEARWRAEAQFDYPFSGGPVVRLLDTIDGLRNLLSEQEEETADTVAQLATALQTYERAVRLLLLAKFPECERDVVRLLLNLPPEECE